MSRAIFPLKMPAILKEVIHDRAQSENQTQTALRAEAVKQYLLTPQNQKTASYSHPAKIV